MVRCARNSCTAQWLQNPLKKGTGITAGARIVTVVMVGENAVVAAGAVVNRDVAGVPARLIKTTGVPETEKDAAHES